MDTPFVLEQTYQAPLEKVWRALTTTNQLRAWYFPQLLHFEPVFGFEFVFADEGSPYQKDWRVTQVVAEQRLAHSWAYKGYAGSSEVIFDLAEQGTTTKLRLTHTGLASFPQEPPFARARFENGWLHLLGSNLRSYVETP